MGKRVALVLAGCGVFDGSEIHEASAALVHLSRGGAEVAGGGGVWGYVYVYAYAYVSMARRAVCGTAAGSSPLSGTGAPPGLRCSPRRRCTLRSPLSHNLFLHVAPSPDLFIPAQRPAWLPGGSSGRTDIWTQD